MEVAKRMFIPMLTTRNTRGIDVLVSNADGSKSCTIQVKAGTGDSFPVFSNTQDFPSAEGFYEKLKGRKTCEEEA